MFELMISDLRKRERWHNDKILHHAAMYMEIARRTNHSRDLCLQSPLCLFKFGTFLGFASFERTQRTGANGMTFMAVKHVENRFVPAVQCDMLARDETGLGVPALSDELRRWAQRLDHTLPAFHRFGQALGTDAISNVRMDEQGNPVFCNPQWILGHRGCAR
jgi:hypothetical protein